MKKILTILLLVGFTIGINSEAKAQGATCGAATALTSGTALTAQTITDVAGTAGGDCGSADSGTGSTAAGCAYGWYSITTTAAQTIEVALNVTSGATQDARLEIYSGTCAALVLEDCDRQTNTSDGLVSYIAPAAGTYYIRVTDFNCNANVTYEIKATLTGAPCGATALTSGTALTGETITDVTAVSGTVGGGNGGDCAASTDNSDYVTPLTDIAATVGCGYKWYSITAASAQTIEVAVANAASGDDIRVDLYSGTCSSLTRVDCDKATGQGLVSYIAPESGTYYIRVTDFNCNANVTFDIKATLTGAPCAAGTLTAGNNTGFSLTDVTALSTGVGAGFGGLCSTTQDYNTPVGAIVGCGYAWHKIDVPGASIITIDLTANNNARIELFQGASCTSYTPRDCGSGSTTPNVTYNYTTNAPTTFFVRVTDEACNGALNYALNVDLETNILLDADKTINIDCGTNYNFYDSGGVGGIGNGLYDDNSNYDITFVAPVGQSIKVTFKNIWNGTPSTSPGICNSDNGYHALMVYNGVQDACEPDYLSIYDGAIGTNVIGVYTGLTDFYPSPGVVVSSGNTLSMNFTTQNHGAPREGWEAVIECVSDISENPTDITINCGLGAIFRDDDYNAGGNTNIQPNDQYVVTYCPGETGYCAFVGSLTGTATLNLNDNSDYLYVYNNSQAIGSPIAILTGGDPNLIDPPAPAGVNSCGTSGGNNNTITGITAFLADNPNGCLTFKFVSNNSTNDPQWAPRSGWSLPIECVECNLGNGGGTDHTTATLITSNGSWAGTSVDDKGDSDSDEAGAANGSLCNSAGLDPNLFTSNCLESEITRLENTIWYKFVTPVNMCLANDPIIQLDYVNCQNFSSAESGVNNGNGVQIMIWRMTAGAGNVNFTGDGDGWDNNYNGTSVGNNTLVYCEDKITAGEYLGLACLLANTTYYIMIDGFTGQHCYFDLYLDVFSADITAAPVLSPSTGICSGGTFNITQTAKREVEFVWSTTNLTDRNQIYNLSGGPQSLGVGYTTDGLTYKYDDANLPANIGCNPITYYIYAIDANFPEGAGECGADHQSAACRPYQMTPIVVYPTPPITNIVTDCSFNIDPNCGASNSNFVVEYSADGSTGWTAEGAGVPPTPTSANNYGYYARVRHTSSPTDCGIPVQVFGVGCATTCTLISPTLSSNSPICAGATLNLTASTLPSATGYSWSGPNGFTATSQNPTISSATVAATGTYTVTVTNSAIVGCTATASISVVVNALPVPTITAPVTVCAPATPTLTAGGGTSYAWSASGGGSISGATNVASVTATSSGTYNVTVTSNGCTATTSTTVTINPLPIATASSNSPICVGSTLNLTATGGGTYSWEGPNGFSSTSATPSIAAATTAASGTYTVTVTSAANCAATASTTVTVNTPPTASITGTNTICAGSSTIFTASPSGASYLWLPGGEVTQSITATTAGVYSVTVTNSNGCTSVATRTLTINAAPDANFPVPASVCEGSAMSFDGSSSTAGSGTITDYTWIWGDGSANTSSATATTTHTFPASGTYNVTLQVTNSNACVNTESHVITVAPNPDITNITVTQPTCAIATGGVTFNVPMPATNYQYQIDGGAFTAVTANPTTISSLVVGSHTLIVRSIAAPQCSASISFTLIAATGCGATCTAPGMTLSNTSVAFCQSTTSQTANYQYTALANGSTGAPNRYDLTQVFGTTIAGASVTNQTLAAATSNIGISVPAGTAAGSYTFMLKIYNNTDNTCAAQYPLQLTINPTPTATLTNDGPKCTGATVNLTATGGGTYTWGAGVTAGVGGAATVTTAGTYTVTVTSAAGCSTTASTTVSYNALPVPTITAPVTVCAPATPTLTAGGGTSYAWSASGGGSISGATNVASVTATSSGTYNVTVTSNGCTATTSTTVTINPLPTATASSNSPICVGSTLNLTATGGGTYSWAGPNGFTSTSATPSIAAATTAASGTYTVTVTSAANCAATASTTVTVNTPPTASITGTNTICAGSSTIFTASPSGASYLWLPGGEVTQSITATTAGVYSVTVTNSNGCTSVATRTLTINAAPDANFPVPASVCEGSAMSFDGSSSTAGSGTITDYTWIWGDGSANTSSATATTTHTFPASGTYNVTLQVTNSNACVNTESHVITVAPNPDITNITVTQPTCAIATGGVTFNVPMPATNYQYQIDGGAFTAVTANPTTISSLVVGSHTLIVRSIAAPQCSASISFTLIAATGCGATCTAPGMTLSNTSVAFCQSTTSQTANYQYTALANGSTGAPNRYDLTQVFGTTIAGASVTNQTLAAATSNIGISVPAGTAAGSYTFMLKIYNNTDNTCAAQYPLQLTINPTPTATLTNDGPKCTGATVNLTATGGGTYTWGAGVTAGVGGAATVTTAGTYTVTVTSAAGCSTTASTTVSYNALPVPTAGSNSPICAGSTLSLSATGGGTYSWSGPNGFTATGATPSIASATTAASGTYTVTVTSNGCTATTSTTVTINPLPAATASSNSPICVGSTLNLTATGGGTYSWAGPNGFTSASATPSIAAVTTAASGTYTVTVTSAANCAATASTIATVNPLPTVSIVGDLTVCDGSGTGTTTTTLVSTGTGAISYVWSNGVTANSIIVGAGTYSVTATGIGGCQATATVTVTASAAECTPITNMVTISGTAFNDSNNDGLIATETGIISVPVFLYDATGTLIDATTTDIDGNYSFSVPENSGTYFVGFDAPTGYIGGIQPDTDPIDADDSDANPTTGVTPTFTVGTTNITDIDGGFVQTGSIAGNVFADNDQNGQDDSNIAYPNVNVYLLNSSGSIIATVKTDDNGDYLFTDVPPGSYTVDFATTDPDLPIGSSVTTQNTGSDATDSDISPTTGETATISVAPGQDVIDVDAGLLQTIDLVLTKSANVASVQTGGSLTYIVTVRNLGPANATGVSVGDVMPTGFTYGSSSPAATQSGSTLTWSGLSIAAGQSVNLLVNGTVSATSGTLTNYAEVTTADQPDINSTPDSTPDTDTPTQNDEDDAPVTVTAPATTYTISGVAFDDQNNNGLNAANPADPGIGSVLVSLLNNNGLVVAQVLTAADGTYSFTGVLPGTYSVSFGTPDNYVGGIVGATGTSNISDTNDSDANASTGTTPTFAVSNADVPNVDAGFVATGSISGTAFGDPDQNGQDNSNIDYPNVSVTLLDSNGTIVATTTTDSNGNYTFTDVPPGSYTVDFATTDPDLPIGSSVTTQNTGSDATDSDISPTTGETATISVAPGQDVIDVDAGLLQTIDLVLTKSANVASVQTGGSLTYIVTVRNLGPANATGVSVGDVMPTGFTYGSSSPAATQSGSTLTWSGLSIAAGQSVNLLVNGTVSATSGTLTNYAEVTTADQPDINSTPDSTPDTDTPTQNDEDDAPVTVTAPATTYTISGVAFDDQNNNGLNAANPADPGIGSILVSLLNNNGLVVAQVLTAADGTYSFTGVLPGTYSVSFGTPDNYVGAIVGATGTSNISDTNDSDANASTGTTPTFAVSNADVPNVDAGFVATGSISGTAFGDPDQNGQDNSNIDYPNVSVTLLDSNGTIVATTTTDSNGNYTFTDVPPGSYTVDFATTDPDLPIGSSVTTQNTGSDATDSDISPTTGETATISVAPGQDVIDVDAGLLQTIDLVLTKSANVASVQTGGSLTYIVTVRNLGPANATGVSVGDVMPTGFTYGSSSPAATQSGSTLTWSGLSIAAGQSVNLLVNGTVSATSGTLTNYAEVTTADQPDINSTPDSTPDTDTPTQNDEDDAPVTVTAPATTYTISGVAFDDQNNNGLNAANPADPGIGSVLVSLLNNNGLVVAQVLTAADGTYSFTGVLPGTYSVSFGTPDNYVGGIVGATGTSNISDTNDSDANASTGTTPTFAVSNADVPNVDAGFVATGSISGTAFGDPDQNGQDNSNIDYPNVSVTLLDSNGTIVATTTTDSNGNYTFTDVPPGSYTVDFATTDPDLPIGSSVTTQNTGSDATDSDISPTTGETATISVAPGQDVIDVDAGLLQTIDLVLTKSANVASVQTGGSLTYIVTVRNLGPANATGVSVGDVMPTGFTYGSSSPAATQSGSTLTWSGLSIAAGQSVNLLVNGTVSATSGTLTNYAEVTTADQPDINSTPDSTPDTDTPTQNDEDDAPVTVTAPATTYTISGVAFDDQNNNGLNAANPADPGIGSILVSLLNNNGLVVAQVLTAADGTYSFTGVLPGTYSVSFGTPDNYVGAIVGATGTSNISDTNDSDANASTGTTPTFAVSNADVPNVDAGFVATGSISGTAFGDPDQNGQDNSNIDYPNVSVTLLDSNGTIVATTTTDSNGNYTFTDVPPGSYTVDFATTDPDLPIGSSVTTQNTGSDATDSDISPTTGETATISVAPGQDVIDVDAGLLQTIDLVLTKSANVASVQTGGSLTYIVTVRNLGPANATGVSVGDVMPTGFTYGSSSPAATQSGSTLTWSGLSIAAGQSVNLLVNGTVSATSGTLTNYAEVTTADQPDINSTPDSTPDTDTPTQNDEDDAPVTVTAPATTYTISGVAFDDQNNNGLNAANPADPGIGSVLVSLLNNNGLVVAQVLTAADGTYSFTGVLPGTYSVSFGTPDNYVGGIVGATGTSNISDTNDSDANASTGTTPTFAVSNADVPNVDAGFVATGSISGTAFGDPDQNGQDNSNIDYPNVSVTLLDSNGTIVATTTTDSNGNYTFTDVPPGSYTVDFATTDPDLPIGSSVTTQNTGSDATDSDISPTTGETATISVAPGQDVIDVDAGLLQTIDLVLTKSANVASVQTGGSLTYIVTVRNLGPANATGVSVGDVMPTGFTYGSSSPAATQSGSTLTWSGLSIAAGQSVNLLVNGTVSATSGTLTNYAEVTTADQPDINSTPDSTPDTDTPTQNDEDDAPVTVTAPATTYTISGVAFDDQNNNGLNAANPADPGIGSVLVSLLNNNGLVVAQVLTAADGTYSFAGVLPGTYSVSFGTPDNYVGGIVGATGTSNISDTNDSDANASTGTTPTFAVSNADVPNVDAGFVATGSISGTAFGDPDQNGQDNSNIDYPNVSVTLLDSNGTIVATTTTDSNGNYTFTDVPPGSGYHVVFDVSDGDLPDNPVVTTQNTGGNNTTDSDINSNGVSDPIAVAPGQNNGDNDAGFYPMPPNTVNADNDFATTQVDTPVTIPLFPNDEDAEGNTFTVTTGSVGASDPLVPGATFTINPITGVLEYTPAPGFTGIDIFSYQICDNGTPQACDEALVVVTIEAAPDNTVNADNNSATTPYNTPVIIDILSNDEDAEGDNFSITPGSVGQVIPPTHGDVTVNPDGTVTYTPDPDYVGTDVFSYEICDDVAAPLTACDVAVVTVEILPPAPNSVNADNDNATTAIDTPVIIDILSNDEDAEGDNFSITPGSVGDLVPPTDGTVEVNPDGTVTYTPNDGFYGTDVFSYQICDDVAAPLTACDIAIVTVTIPFVENTVIANNDQSATDPETPVIIPVCNNDLDPEGNNFAVTTNFTQAANGTVTYNGDCTFTYTPNPGFEGIDQFEYEICDDGTPQACDPAVVTIIVSDTINSVIANDDTEVTEQNTPVEVPICANDFDPQGDNFDVTTFTQPANGTVTYNDDCIFTYTPNTDYFGTDTFTYTICDDNATDQACDEAVVTIVIPTPNNTVNPENDEETTEQNECVVIAVMNNDSDAEGDNFMVTSNFTQAQNGTVTLNADGTFTYCPNTDYIGTDVFTYEICDTGNPIACEDAIVIITIEPQPDNTVDANPDEEITEVNTCVEVFVLNNDTDAEGNSFDISSFGQAANGTVTQENDGTLTYCPNDGFTGVDVFTYEICDNGNPIACDQTVVTITIEEPFNDVTATPDQETTTINTCVAIDVMANDFDPQGDNFDVSSFEQALNGTVTQNADGTLLYCPNDGFTGTDVFTYQICDDGNPTACDITTVTITIDEPNSVNADDDQTSTEPGNCVDISVLSNDEDAQGDNFGITGAGTANNGTVTINADGTITYCPNDGFTGTDTFTYEICDNGNPVACDQATVTVTITTDNTLIAVDDDANTPAGVCVEIDVTANDFDPQGDNFTISDFSQALNGTVTLNGNGTITYCPNDGFTGVDVFTYEICDDANPPVCEQATVTILVEEPNNVVAVDDATTTTINTPVTIDITENDFDPQGDDFSISTVGEPSNGEVLVNTDGTVVYIPDNNFVGTDTFTYTICDVLGACDEATVIVTIGIDCSNSDLGISSTAFCTDGIYQVVALLSGGVAPYTYTVTFEDGSSSLSGESDGTNALEFSSTLGYTIVMSDALGCQFTHDTYASLIPCQTVAVELLSYTGEVMDNGNLLRWITASEINNDYFTLQHSTDGINYKPIAQIKGNGNSAATHAYQFLHQDAPSGISYYALSQTDFDGTVHHEGTVTLMRRQSQLAIVNVQPIPASTVMVATFAAAQAGETNISLYDVAGKLAHTETINAINGNNQVTIDVNNLAAGIYLMTIQNGSDISTLKVVKQ
jgi:uncharacterized repeat protein (TIGR01451 family)